MGLGRLQFLRRHSQTCCPSASEPLKPHCAEEPVHNRRHQNGSPVYSHIHTLFVLRETIPCSGELSNRNHREPHIFSTCCGLNPCSRSLRKLRASWRLASRIPAASRTRSQ